MRTLPLTAAFCLVPTLGLFAPRASEAHVVPGEYSLEAIVGPESAPAGGQFTLTAGVYHSAGPYQAVQWHIDYDPALVGVIGIARDGAAPAQCGQQNDNGERALLGCIDLGGANISYSGPVFNITMQCKAAGNAVFTVVTGLSASFVKVGAANQPAHVHGDSISCGEGSAPPPGDLCTVAGVVDGDTFDCNDGRRVRMLQIDAQPLDACGGEWAKAALQYIFLTPGRVVRLEYDVTSTDAFGNVWAAPIWRGNDGVDYNLSIIMVYVGLAKAADYGDGNTKLLSWINASQTWASVAQWNMWAPGKTYNGGC